MNFKFTALAVPVSAQNPIQATGQEIASIYCLICALGPEACPTYQSSTR